MDYGRLNVLVSKFLYPEIDLNIEVKHGSSTTSHCRRGL